MDNMSMDLTAMESKRRNPSATTSSAAIIAKIPHPDQVLWTSTRPHDQADGFRYMQNLLGLSNSWIDEAGGFGEGQIGKYLGPTRAKNIGPLYYQTLCSLLAVEWRMHVDMAQVAKMEGLWEQRRPQYVQPLARAPSKEIIERARPHVLNEYLSELGRKGARARWSK